MWTKQVARRIPPPKNMSNFMIASYEMIRFSFFLKWEAERPETTNELGEDLFRERQLLKIASGTIPQSAVAARRIAAEMRRMPVMSMFT